MLGILKQLLPIPLLPHTRLFTAATSLKGLEEIVPKVLKEGDELPVVGMQRLFFIYFYLHGFGDGTGAMLI